jgi:hypothetical protein
MVNAEVALGDLLRRSADPTLSDADRAAAQAGIKDAKKALQDAIDDFHNSYAPSVYDSQALDVHQRLVPSGMSLLTRYGDLAMTKRFLTRADSLSLRALDDEFAQVEAMAALMSAEYYSTNTDTVTDIFKDYRDQSDEELTKLPKMIPARAVIDLGAVNQVSTDKKPDVVSPDHRRSELVPG